jgi:hypothetical protein
MRMKAFARACAVVLVLGAGESSAQIVIESLSGPVTANEVSSYKTFMQGRPMSDSNLGNAWVYGNSGTDIESLGMMYEVTGDRAILDRMIQYADKALNVRNHPTTGRIIWTGKRELCWPNKDTTAPDAKYCGSESGDVIGHIAYTAKLILQTPAIWSQAVAVGDPFGYGATYKTRAQKYVTEMDKSLDTFMTPSFVKASDANHYRWPDTDSYGALGTSYASARGKPIPWNQHTMISNGYLRLAESHEILADAPSRVSQYYAIVKSNNDWFLSDLHPYTRDGYTVYDWGYSLGRTSEDTGHGQYDMWGLCRDYERGNMGVSQTTMTNFANTLIFVIYDQPTNTWFQRVNGVTGGDPNRSDVGYAWLCLSRFRTSPRDIYAIAAASNRSRAATRPIDAAAIFVQKHRRAGGTPRPTPTPTPTATPVPTNVPTPTPTPTPAGGSGYYRIVARHSSKVLAVLGASTANSGDVVQWTYGGATANDEWQLVDLGTGYSRVVNRHSGKVLNVAGVSTANGANVDQWSWANVNQQQWQITDLGSGYHRFTARHSGKVLNVSGAGTADGANVDQWSWANVNQQQFQLIAVP